MHSRCFDKRIARYASEMTDFRSARSLGERIQAARKARGMSARELAEAIGGIPTQSTIENIETGRKVSVDVVQLLNIAMATRVPLSFFLAPLADPDGPLDLPGLSPQFSSLNVAEFEAWLAAAPDGAYRPFSIEERNAISELHALRELRAQLSEVNRLEVALSLQRDIANGLEEALISTNDEKLRRARQEVERLSVFLRSAGWDVK